MSSENGLDSCNEDGLDPKTNFDAQMPNVVTKAKEPAVDQDNVKNESGLKEEVVSESSVPKKKGRKAKKVKNESKADKEVDDFATQLRASKSDKKEGSITENASNGEIEQEEVSEQKKELIEPVSKPQPECRKKKLLRKFNQDVKTGEFHKFVAKAKKLEKLRFIVPRRSARGGVKRKLDDNKDLDKKKNVIYQSIVDEVHNITEDPSASKTIDPESSPKKIKEIKETKAAAITKAKIKNPTTDVIEVKTNVPTGWVKKLVIRKSGVTKGHVDVYLYSPDGMKFRSKPELAAFLKRTKSSWKMTDFDFSRKEAHGVSSGKPFSKKKENPGKMKVETKSASPNKESNSLSKLEMSKKSPKVKKASKQSKAAIKTEAKSLKAIKNKKK